MQPYCFLIDRSAAKAATLFPKSRMQTSNSLDIAENASDEEIVRKAWLHRCTIVTANGDDFVAEICKFQKKQMRRVCHELNGLIVVPNEFEIQKQIIKIAHKKLRFGGKPIGWPNVWSDNLYVRLRKSGSPIVNRFPRCFYCDKLEVKQWTPSCHRARAYRLVPDDAASLIAESRYSAIPMASC